MPFIYDLNPALGCAVGVVVFLLRPGNNILVTHDPKLHKLVMALSLQIKKAIKKSKVEPGGEQPQRDFSEGKLPNRVPDEFDEDPNDYKHT